MNINQFRQSLAGGGARPEHAAGILDHLQKADATRFSSRSTMKARYNRAEEQIRPTCQTRPAIAGQAASSAG